MMALRFWETFALHLTGLSYYLSTKQRSFILDPNPYKAMRKAIIILSLFYFLASCGNLDKKSNDLQIGQIKAFAEMVAADVKPLALSEPMTKEEADEIWKIAQTIATEQGVEVIREPDLIQTQLFPSDLTDEMEVFIFHKAEALKAYFRLAIY